MGPVAFALLVVAAAALATGSQLRRRFALGMSLGTAGFAFLVPVASPAAACLLALLGLVQLAKIVDLAGPVEIEGWRARLLFVVSPYDTRQIRPLGPTRRSLVWLPAAIAGAVAFSMLALRATHPVAAWLAGLAGFYLGAESVLGLIELAHRAGGRSTPAALDAPLLSTSVGEFWGRRWNRPVSDFLRRTHLLPLRRRRLPVLGMTLAFVSSAALHALPVFAAVGAGWAAVMAAFFLVQLPVIYAERRLRVRAWPRPAARVWTLGWLLGTSPLFLFPVLAIAHATSGGVD